MSAIIACLLLVCVGFLVWAAVTTGLYVRCKQAAVSPAPSSTAEPLYQVALKYLDTPNGNTQRDAFNTLLRGDPAIAPILPLLKTKALAEVMPLIGTTMIKLYGYVYGPVIMTALTMQVRNETSPPTQGVVVLPKAAT